MPRLTRTRGLLKHKSHRFLHPAQSTNVRNVSANPSSGEIELVDDSGVWRATISPQGAALLELSFKGSQLASSPSTSHFNAFAGKTLAPWPNRLAGGTWSLGDAQFQAPINEPARNTALHGLVFDRNFEVVGRTTSEVSLSTRLGSDACYPFAVEVTVVYSLTDAGLHVRFEAANQDPGSQAVPFGIGSHPYFDLEPDSTLSLPALSTWLTDVNLIPTDLAPASECGVEAFQPVPVIQLALDHCFADLNTESDQLVRSRLTRPKLRGSTVIWQEPAFKHLMVFTLFGKFTGRDHAPIAIEPQTCPANALQSGDDLIWLPPGERWSASWGVEFEEDLP